MTGNKSEFQPDYAAPMPGEMLRQVLKDSGIKIGDLAKRCGRPNKTISEIIGGHTAITSDTALQFERVLGIGAEIWLSFEAEYRLRLARSKQKLASDAVDSEDWARNFKIKHLQKLKLIDHKLKSSELVEAVLRVFGVSNIEVWEEYWGKRVNQARLKQQGNSGIDRYNVAIWLRKVELSANDVCTEKYKEASFRELLTELRALTQKPWRDSQPILESRCKAAGVAVVFVPYIENTGLRGAAYWAKKDKPVIALSDHSKSDARIWFTFFHEAAHILLHSKKALFIEGEKRGNSEEAIENEANDFAAETIIPRSQLNEILNYYGDGLTSLTSDVLRQLAKQMNVSASLLLARLQREEVISNSSSLNKELNEKVEFSYHSGDSIA